MYKNVNLFFIGCYNNRLTSLNVKNNQRLFALSCYDNRLEHLDLLNNLILSQIEFIDVREKHEKPKITSLNYKQVPLSQIKEHLDIINSNKNGLLKNCNKKG